MIQYDRFKGKFHSQKRSWGPFSENDLMGLETKLPADVVEFLRLEGLSSYQNQFFWTTLPGDFHDALTAWGLTGNKCHAFMRSAFGACVFFSRKKYFYLDPLEGRVVSLGDDFYLLLNYMLTLDVIAESGFFVDVFRSLKADPQRLHPDEIFAFASGFPQGGRNVGALEVEIVKTRSHVPLMAQRFGGKARRIRQD